MNDWEVIEGGGPVKRKAIIWVTQAGEIRVCGEKGFDF